MPATWRSRIPEITHAIPLRVGAAVRSGTEQMASRAAEAAPRGETGRLADSIEARAGQSEFQAGISYGIWAEFYWFFSEFGTIHEPAQPWLLPTVESEYPLMLAEVRKALAEL